jgi:hypothetical protein
MGRIVVRRGAGQGVAVRAGTRVVLEAWKRDHWERLARARRSADPRPGDLDATGERLGSPAPERAAAVASTASSRSIAYCRAPRRGRDFATLLDVDLRLRAAY